MLAASFSWITLRHLGQAAAPWQVTEPCSGHGSHPHPGQHPPSPARCDPANVPEHCSHLSPATTSLPWARLLMLLPLWDPRGEKKSKCIDF